jgi:tRNA1Val (adenine37-N6)-methyltransferase
MANTWFQFKQFKVEQRLSAMKVGTDGVLLGSWADISDAIDILDIGTGTGLIALMLAQRQTKAQIDAVEIDKDAYTQAQENFLNSKWANRLRVYNTAIQEFRSDKKYDFIVSNPPYFENSFLAKGDKRNLARHNDSLKSKELLESVSKLLKPGGVFSLILPFDACKVFIEEALVNTLYVNKVCNVYPTSNSDIKRVLLEFSFIKKELFEEEITIEPIKRHEYSQEYINLTKEFYLKF